MIITERAVLSTIVFKLLYVSPEDFATFLASKRHFSTFDKRVSLGFHVALSTIEPFTTARRPYTDLSIQDMLAHPSRSLETHSTFLPCLALPTDVVFVQTETHDNTL